MAGDWIKVELATMDKPEVLELAAMLEIDPDAVLGKLFRVWGWFDQQSRDGHAGCVTGVTLDLFIDRLVHRPGFAACLKKVGWLTPEGIPHFDRHNGKPAKDRALSKERKVQERSRNSHDESVTREEKRREEPISNAVEACRAREVSSSQSGLTRSSSKPPTTPSTAKAQAQIAEQASWQPSPMPDALKPKRSH